MTRTARQRYARSILSWVTVWLASCSGSEPTVIQVKAGATCKDCAGFSECGDSLSNGSCPECEECPAVGFDNEQGAVVECDGSWKVKQKCPGGGSVSCHVGAYTVHCFDAQQKEIHF
jgi:hypothetical protein